jgi:Tol biopolymer transport system component
LTPQLRSSSRKPLVFLFILSVLVVGVAAVPSRGGCTVDTLTFREGTNIAVTASPDGQTLIFDLQNHLWSMPATGGTAKQLTDDFVEPGRPHWSPRGDLVAFQSYATGTFHIWVMKPDGTGLRQLTDGHGDDREPHFSPDGTRIAFASDRAFKGRNAATATAGDYDIWVVDVASGALTQWTSSPADEFEPTWSPDGSEIVYVSGTGATGTSILASDAIGNTRTLVTAPTDSRVNSPVMSPDGSSVAYEQFAANKSTLMVSGQQIGTSNDVFPFHATWLSADRLLYAADGKIRISSLSGATDDVPFTARYRLLRPRVERKRFDFDSHRPRQAKGIVGPTLSPDGTQVLFQALNQIWLMKIGGHPHQLTDDSYYKCDPSWAPDGKRIAYSSDKAGTEDLYVLDLTTGTEQRVSSLPGAEVSSAWSSDGTQLAFQDQTGATFILDLATGNVRQIVAFLFAPSKPNWFKSGKTLALGALKPYTRRFREGTSQILTVDVASGAPTYTEPAPFKSLSTRGEDGPVYSPDGSAVAFVMESTLWVRPVDGNGVPTGDAKQLNREATDAPTWSGDSKQLLYLSNGQLRLISRDGGAPTTIPLDLSWTPDMPRGRTVVHAGKLWDGLGPTVQTDVDIVIRGHRIQKIRPHKAAADPEGNAAEDSEENEASTRYVDASNLTVVPGLWESHTHEWISGKFYGDRLGRLWMAYGVTSLNSVGDPAYRAPETRESFASGERVGPRFFATGEAIDGERVYYNFMRPTNGTDEQILRELSRARALDYDMVKTYVRLRHLDNFKITQWVHENMGVWTASHYMLSPMAFGADGMTHVSATTRTGFAYTRSSAGISYGDMRAVFRTSNAFDISTTFNSSLYADDPKMVEDPRLQVLNTPWDQMALVHKRDLAVTTDQTVSLDNLTKEEDTVQAIRRGGGVVLAGTDSSLDNVATALHLNLRAQVKVGGLPPWQALQSATLLTAKEVGVGKDLGSVERGKLADLAFISGDPLTEIKDLANVQAVMKNGRLYTIAELMQPFASPAAQQSSAAAPQHRLLAPTPEAALGGQRHWWHDPEQMIEDDHR